MKTSLISFILASLSIAFWGVAHSATRTIPVIPLPAQYEWGNGFFPIDSVLFFSGLPLAGIECVVDERLSDLGKEGYLLDVTRKGISLKAQSEAGLFYGKVTLRQLYTKEGIPCIRIKDIPRFAHRGIMLDVSRHFFSKEEVKKLIDRMSFYKLNRFHWHLTDDGGWRFEVDDYPELTRTAAFRTDHVWQDWWKNGGKFAKENTPGACGGYYTKADIKEIVDYASERFITIIPEVEFPGHSKEVFAAYPNLCCAGKPYSGGTFCVGNEDTYTFMNSVLKTVMELFPSEIIHIGGDETNTTPWTNCAKCQELMRREGMADVHELHNYIIGKAENILRAGGRRLTGWDEIASEKLDKSSVVMSWQGEQAGIDAARKGYDVILTPLHYLYLDYFQSSPDKEPLAHDGYTPIEKVYAYNPVPDTLGAAHLPHFLGIQGNIWTEWIANEEHLEYMAFPRTLAVAEVAWTPQQMRSWSDFRSRLAPHISRLQQEGVNTYTLSSDVEAVMESDVTQKMLKVILKCERDDVDIRYTTDGKIPTEHSLPYHKPLLLKDSLLLKAATFREGKMQGDVFTQTYYYHKGIGKKVESSLRNVAARILTDGCIGGKTYLDGSWVNFSGNQYFTLDLGCVEAVHQISTRWMQLHAGARRNLPQQIEVLFSVDGKEYVSGGTILKKDLEASPALQYQYYSLNTSLRARFVRINVLAGNGGMSLDEFVVG
ncbi:family 20 glycosylhydrolase [Bacteroides sp.]|uniref:family 20 glycosylhydrolase n=1 Tax=Bacteroides sp. TaxID=29523 RepID=UPI002605F78E|nr:family 20 glycosylhydrolase [Bacteroides sp.]